MSTIKILGMVDGRRSAFDGQYVVEYDPGRNGRDPEGRPTGYHLATTADKSQALQLPVMEAWALWRRDDPRRPRRPDGRPNRPLTAFSVEISNEL